MAKAGWFANPDGSPTLRYFDGMAWSAHTIALGPPPPSDPTAPETPGDRSVSPATRSRLPFQSGPVVAALVAGLVMGAVVGLDLGGQGKRATRHIVGPHAISSGVSTPVRPATVPTSRAGARGALPPPTLALTP